MAPQGPVYLGCDQVIYRDRGRPARKMSAKREMVWKLLLKDCAPAARFAGAPARGPNKSLDRNANLTSTSVLTRCL